MGMLRTFFILCLIAIVTANNANTQATSNTISKAFMVQLSSEAQIDGAVDRLEAFHQQATNLDYSVRHEFRNLDVWSGLSIQVTGDITEADALAQLQNIPGVVSVYPVYNVGLPLYTEVSVADPLHSDSNPPAIKPVASNSGNLAGALQMGSVDKLHLQGIKGKGIKIGVIDTGVDYRHPALGGGFGPGFKIAGGYSFVLDNGTLQNGPDPLATCYGGAHGTHVTGILGMDPISSSFDITGVAPEASIYMYRVFDCFGEAGSDTIAAAMARAITDGVDVISMSIGIGAQSFSGGTDPLATISKKVTDSGIGLVIAIANDANGSELSNDLYTAEWPGTELGAIGVGAVSNADFPLVYPSEDSYGSSLEYAAVYPFEVDSLEVFILDDGCSSSEWSTAFTAIANLNQTIIGFPLTQNCAATQVGYNSAEAASAGLKYIFGYIANTTDPYLSQYNTPSRGFFGNTSYINFNVADGQVILDNFSKSGGYGKYKLFFGNGTFTSPPQPAGGLMDYYSSFGPSWHDYNLKPQISAPGGDILSTWPLGIYGEYTILSGTSMATPYLAACYALVKSQFSSDTPAQIQARLQSTAKPLPWVYDSSMLASTAQQGAGLVNAYAAIKSQSIISPGQIIISDNSRTVYGAGNVTIENKSGATKTYTLSHQGAGYMDYYLSWMEKNQQANYGTAKFPTPTVVVPAGQSTTVPFSVSAPPNVTPSNLPVFSGFIGVTSASETFSIPYIGPPYSLYNTDYIFYQPSSAGVALPSMYADTSTGTTYNTGLLSVTASSGFGGSLPTIQWSQHIRVDLLPANTNITAHYYGFDPTVTYPYQPSKFAPNSTFVGYPSFGTLVDLKGYNWPGSFAPSGTTTVVTGSDGVKWAVGSGDYRWYAAVLRWGGDESKLADWDTWLGPIIRFV